MAVPKHAVKTQAASGWAETAKTLLYAGLIAIGVRTVAVEPFNIPSGSMIPTLLVGDFLFVTKYSYGYSRYSMPFSPPVLGWARNGRLFGSMPHRGDVVVFRGPRDPSVDYIKRVIGLPGDHVQVKEGQLFINGAQLPRDPAGTFEAADENGTRVLTQQYTETLPNGVKHPVLKYSDEERFDAGSEVDANNTPDYVVPDGDLFMMGDNRDNSADSRFQNSMGFVPLENIVGHARFVFLSVDADHPWWQFWWWPMEVRWDRVLHTIR